MFRTNILMSNMRSYWAIRIPPWRMKRLEANVVNYVHVCDHCDINRRMSMISSNVPFSKGLVLYIRVHLCILCWPYGVHGYLSVTWHSVWLLQSLMNSIFRPQCTWIAKTVFQRHCRSISMEQCSILDVVAEISRKSAEIHRRTLEAGQMSTRKIIYVT